MTVIRRIPGRPSLGAWLSYGLGSSNEDLPTFIVLNATWTGRKEAQALFSRLWGSGPLASQHSGVPLRNAGDPVLYLSNPKGVDRRVRVAKLAYGSVSESPMRPSREASLMHRLLEARQDPLPMDVTVSIWRHIIASSTLVQADATVNLVAQTAADGAIREMLRGQFGCMPLVVHDTEDAVLTAVAADPDPAQLDRFAAWFDGDSEVAMAGAAAAAKRKRDAAQEAAAGADVQLLEKMDRLELEEEESGISFDFPPPPSPSRLTPARILVRQRLISAATCATRT